MAKKATQVNKPKKLPKWLTITIVALIVAYILFQQTIYTKVIPEGQPRLIFNIIVLVILVFLFVYMLIRQSIAYSMFLTNTKLTIDKRGVFYHKVILEIYANAMLGLKKAENYDKTDVKPMNCTISTLKDPSKGTYVLIYKEKGVRKAVKLQCDAKFYNELKLLVKLNQKKNAK